MFNNKSFYQGGRYYGSWWTGCPSVLRKYITINGDPTVELDYSGIHIHLLYAIKRINYAAKKEDPYILDDGIPDRELNKKILLRALNAKTEIKARDSVYNQLRKEGKLATYNLRNKDPIARKLTLLKEKHAPIADYIAEDYGIKLQYYDSSIIEKAITYGIKHKIPVLSVHDSVIVQEQYASLIKDKMWEYFTELVNVKLNASVRYNPKRSYAWEILKEQVSSKVSNPVMLNYVTNNNLYQRIKPSKEFLSHWIKQSELINIKLDTRTNNCNGNCKHKVRVNNYLANRRNYPPTVRVKVINKDTNPLITIS